MQNDAKHLKMTGSLAYGYPSESTHGELSNEYQHDMVWMVFKNLCIHVLWTKEASALEWLTPSVSITAGSVGLKSQRDAAIACRLICLHAKL